MADRPILFSAPMVRALIEGRKTQTRRLLKPQPGPCEHAPGRVGEFVPSIDEEGVHCATCGNGVRLARTKSGVTGIPVRFAKGDRLWVRETWAEHHPAGIQEGRFTLPGRAGIPGPPGVSYRVIYRADGDPVRVWHCDAYPYRTAAGPRSEIDAKHPAVCSEMPGWTPPIHMPRWASRLTLTVTDVRVERLQAISRHDALAEGVEQESADPPFYYVPGIHPHTHTAVGIEEPGGRHAERSYAKLWDMINGALPWAANPWVIAVTFSVEQRNIDANA